MADVRKVLGQIFPVAKTLVILYTVPAGKSAYVSRVIVCNHGGASKYRVSIAIGGAADDMKQYIAYDTAINGRDNVPVAEGVLMAAGDVMRVWADDATIGFSIFGSETPV